MSFPESETDPEGRKLVEKSLAGEKKLTQQPCVGITKGGKERGHQSSD